MRGVWIGWVLLVTVTLTNTLAVNHSIIQTPTLLQSCKAKWILFCSNRRHFDCSSCPLTNIDSWQLPTETSISEWHFSDWIEILNKPMENGSLLLRLDQVVSWKERMRGVNFLQKQIQSSSSKISSLAVSLYKFNENSPEYCQICMDGYESKSPLGCEKHFACGSCSAKIYRDLSYKCPFCRYAPPREKRASSSLPLEGQLVLIRNHLDKLMNETWLEEYRDLALTELSQSKETVQNRIALKPDMAGLHGIMMKWYLQQSHSVRDSCTACSYMSPRVLIFLLCQIITWLNILVSYSAENATVTNLIAWSEYWTPIQEGESWRQIIASIITQESPLRSRVISAAHQLKKFNGGASLREYVVMSHFSREFQTLANEIDSFVQSIIVIAHNS